MPDTAEDNPVENRLNALDPGLPFLASQAAVELDHLLLGQDVDLNAARRLARRLEGSTELIPGTEDRKSLMDSATVSVFNNAIVASGFQKVQSLSELAHEAWQIAEALQNPQVESSDRPRVERLRTFCNYLSQSAAAHERSLYDAQSADMNWS